MAPPPSVKSGGNRIFDFRSGLRSSCATRNPPPADRTGASGAFSIAEGPRPSEAVVHARTHSPRSFTIHAPSAPLARSAATSARTPAPLPFFMARPSTAESVALPYTARAPAVHRRRARAPAPALVIPDVARHEGRERRHHGVVVVVLGRHHVDVREALCDFKRRAAVVG